MYRFQLYIPHASILRNQSSFLFLVHTSYHHWMFDIVLSSDDDEVIDAVYTWAMDRDQATFGSCASSQRESGEGRALLA